MNHRHGRQKCFFFFERRQSSAPDMDRGSRGKSPRAAADFHPDMVPTMLPLPVATTPAVFRMKSPWKRS